MANPKLYGADYSVYVRIARMVLEEKGIAHDVVPVDIFAPGGPAADYLKRHPFGRIPAFEHDGFGLYETGAITRYIDDAFPGPPLQPAEARGRARVNQIISILDSYANRTLVWDIYVERIDAPKEGRASNEAMIASALPRAATCLQALDAIMGGGPWLAGQTLTLADLHAAPVFACFLQTSEGLAMMADHPRLKSWWDRISDRPSFRRTQPS